LRRSGATEAIPESPLEQTGTASSLALLAVTDSGVISHKVALRAMDELAVVTDAVSSDFATALSLGERERSI
jgi:hypothetical protein